MGNVLIQEAQPGTADRLSANIEAQVAKAGRHTMPGLNELKSSKAAEAMRLMAATHVPDTPDTSEGAPSNNVSNVAKPSKPSSNVGNRLLDLLKRHIGASTEDLMIVVLWILHTWVLTVLYTTARLLISSIMPGAGKTTLLDWIRKFSRNAILMASISSAALLARLAEQQFTMLVDEADRSLRRDNPLTQDFLSIVNSGYKSGATRPTLVQTKDGNWEPKNLDTFAAVAFAGNNPDLPEDTMQRCIPLFLYPDPDVEDTDWEILDASEEVKDLRKDIEAWANDETVLEELRNRPELPPCVKARSREVWLPLARVAATLADHEGKSWLAVVRKLAEESVEQAKIDAAEGLRKSSPQTALLRDVAAIWTGQWAEQTFVASKDMCSALAMHDPEAWGAASEYRSITPKRLAGLLKKAGVHATRDRGNTTRGYDIHSFTKPWNAVHVWDMDGMTKPAWLDTLDASATLDTSDGTPSGNASK